MVLEFEEHRIAATLLWHHFGMARFETVFGAQMLRNDVNAIWKGSLSECSGEKARKHALGWKRSRRWEYWLGAPSESHASSTSLPGGRRNAVWFGCINAPSNLRDEYLILVSCCIGDTKRSSQWTLLHLEGSNYTILWCEIWLPRCFTISFINLVALKTFLSS